jgi:hypothetical protein
MSTAEKKDGQPVGAQKLKRINKMATVYEIIQGLSQAAANAYDGALNEEGDSVQAGLSREDGNPLIDRRVIDGFNVRFFGNKMVLAYHSETKLKEVYKRGFEDDIDETLNDVASFLKKEYKKITKDSVSLKQEGETDIRVESSSRVRTWVTAVRTYIIEGVSTATTVPQYSSDTLQDGYKKFLDQGGFLGDRPENDTRPKNGDQ